MKCYITFLHTCGSYNQKQIGQKMEDTKIPLVFNDKG